jgi:hypothetical protein
MVLIPYIWIDINAAVLMKKIFLFIFIFSIVSASQAQYWIQAGGSATVDEGLDIAADGFENLHHRIFYIGFLDGQFFSVICGLSGYFYCKDKQFRKYFVDEKSLRY